ncbi:hypothetical protein [Cellulomonas sp. KRMCY2]|uniref:hypothetical protein n=1 Tax=Cellulomonas sp. KRMCY2 TaxID=1304865 RepID=UPI0012DE67DD|nr:hypothetical protein [Cellulomonas sp. KRMCY2]
MAMVFALVMNASSASAYTRTWTYSGEFKASLQSGTFSNAGGEIKITVDAGNCTPGYDYIRFQLQKQGQLASWADYGTRKNVYCASGVYTFTYPSAPAGTYRMYFDRSGPVSFDENWKTVNGTVYYW